MNDIWLAHHGIKGQRWGVRRFQNPDGSLTDAGKQRLAKEIVKSESLFGREKHTKKLDKHLNELVSDDQKRKLSELNKKWKSLQMDGGEAEDKLWLIVYEKFEKGEDYTFDDAMRDNPKLAKKVNDSEKAFSEYDKEAQKMVRKLVGKYAKTKMNTLSTNVGEKMYKELSKMAKDWEPDTYTSKPKFKKPIGTMVDGPTKFKKPSGAMIDGPTKIKKPSGAISMR